MMGTFLPASSMVNRKGLPLWRQGDALLLLRSLWLKFWGGVHQFCLSMDNILRNLESLSRTEIVWLNTHLVGRLRAVPGIESPGSVAMQRPNGVTCQQEAAVAPLPDRIDDSTPLWTLGSVQGLRRKAGRLTSTRRWCRFRAIFN